MLSTQIYLDLQYSFKKHMFLKTIMSIKINEQVFFKSAIVPSFFTFPSSFNVHLFEEFFPHYLCSPNEQTNKK